MQELLLEQVEQQPSWEDMPVRRETREQIAAEVKAQLPMVIDSLRPKGWRKAVFELRQWGILGVIAGVIVTLLAVAAGAIYQATARVDRQARFETNTEDRLRTIEVQLLDLRAPHNPGSVLKELNRTDQRTFSESLPALRKVLEQPVSAVNPSQATLQGVAEKLRSVNEKSPDYWPVVFEFVNFASATLSGPNVPPSGPVGFLISTRAFKQDIHIGGQVVKFDGAELSDSVFTNCRIIFTENPTIMHNVTFINCVFELPVVAMPNEYLQRTSKELLQSNLTSVSVPNL